MKKILSILTVIIISLSFAGCKAEKKESGYIGISWNMSKDELKESVIDEELVSEKGNELCFKSANVFNPLILESMLSGNSIDVTYTFKGNNLKKIVFKIESDRIDLDAAQQAFDDMSQSLGAVPCEDMKVRYLDDNPKNQPMLAWGNLKTENSKIKFTASLSGISNDMEIVMEPK